MVIKKPNEYLIRFLNQKNISELVKIPKINPINRLETWETQIIYLVLMEISLKTLKFLT